MYNLIPKEEYKRLEREGYYDDDDMRPIPCASPECEGLYIEYDYNNGVYHCPNCGRYVDGYTVSEYLDQVENGENPSWEEPIATISYSDI